MQAPEVRDGQRLGFVSRRRFLAGTVGLAASAALLAACGRGTFGTRIEDTANRKQERRGEPLPDEHQVLRTALFADPISHDWNRSIYCGGIAELFAPLLTFDTEFQPQPWAAEKLSVSADGTKYTFSLRKDATWTNGLPVTADDWVYSFTRLLSPATKAPQAPLYSDIAGAVDFHAGKFDDPRRLGLKAIDRFTFEITLAQPAGYFPMLLALWGSAPAYGPAVEKFGDRWTEPDNIVGNGPFKLTKWNHNSELVVERRSDWWSALPRPRLREVHYTIVPAEQAMDAYRQGDLDLVQVPNADLASAMLDPALQPSILPLPLFTTWYLAGEANQKPFDDLRVRKALQHVIDRDNIAGAVLQGQARVAYGLVHPGFLGYAGDIPEMVDSQRYDPKAAMDMLRGTPYEGGRNWPKVTLTYDAGRDPVRARLIAEAVAKALSRHLNLLVDLEPLDKFQLQDRLQMPLARRNLQLALLSWTPEYPHPHSYDNGLLFANRAQRRHAWADGWVDFQIGNAARLTDQRDAGAIYQQVELRAIAEQAALSPIVYTYGGMLVRPNVHGLAVNKQNEFVVPHTFYRTAFSRDLYIAKI
jgi:ABC-type oligopeptide transport system substrate-binding subunit